VSKVDLEAPLARVLAEVVSGYERLARLRRLSGGASQETYRVELETRTGPLRLAWRRASGGRAEGGDPAGVGLETEARLMRAARWAGVPEPEVLYVMRPEDGLGPGFLMEWLEGETLGPRIVRAPELEAIRPGLARECGRVLARIHAIDPVATGLAEHLRVVSTRDFVKEVWAAYRHFDSPQPMIDYTARWLLEHLPDGADETSPRLVHNDFRNGNLMVRPDGVAAVLDWELAHLGDPVRDLGWICTPSWRFGRHDLPVGGFGRLEDLLDGYEEVSGVRIAESHVRFWEIFGSFWWAVVCLKMAEAARHVADGRVERVGIARRSSECQVDCANAILPGAVELDEDRPPTSSLEMPGVDELVRSVRDFLREDVRSALEGRNAFLALVASNSLDIVLRELTRGPAHVASEQTRLEALLGETAALPVLRQRLAEGLRDGTIALDAPGLADHLRTTVVNQLAIDQPRYPGLAEALGDRTRDDAAV
jgi:aminoglycoside phosphotransferase (APT) family kinase protein